MLPTGVPSSGCLNHARLKQTSAAAKKMPPQPKGAGAMQVRRDVPLSDDQTITANF